MRILTDMTSLAPLGGVEVVTMQVAEALARRGHHLSIAYRDTGPLLERCQRMGASMVAVGEQSLDLRHPTDAIRPFVESAARLARERPDVFWLTRFEHIFWARLVARMARCRIVCHLHHTPMFNRLGLIGKGVSEYLAVSEFVKKAYVERGLAADRVSVVPNGVAQSDYPRAGADSRIASRADLGLPPNAFVVLYMGRIEEQKGAHVLARAWRQLGWEPVDARLVVLGDAGRDTTARRYHSDLHDLLRGTGTHWLGVREDVRPVLHAADLVVVPSTRAEAFGRVIIEGMSAGVPALASDVGGMAEVLTGPMARFLFTPGAVAELANKISELRYWRLSEAGLGDECSEWARNRFSLECQVTAIESALMRSSR
jgi:glycosyltransferase involved in cell wall biosynthesis